MSKIDWAFIGEKVEVAWWFGSIVLSAIVFGWYIRNYQKVSKLEKDILRIKDEIDNLEYTVMQKKRGISQGLIDNLVIRERKPLQAQFERLELERKFILEKLPLVGLFKK